MTPSDRISENCLGLQDCHALGTALDPLSYVHVGPGGVEGRLRISTEVPSPAFGLGLELMRKPHMVLLGMSPGNGFFNRKRVEIAVCGFARLFGNLAVLVPDTIAIHTYRALGYTEREGRDRVKKHGQLLKRRCQRAAELSRVTSPEAKLRVLDWERDVAADPRFPDAYARVLQLFAGHRRFREDILGTSRSILESKILPASISEGALSECAQYLLKELAYLRICRSLLGMDVVVPYHKHFAIAAEYCEGVYDEPVAGVGWSIYDVELFGESDGYTGAHHDAE